MGKLNIMTKIKNENNKKLQKITKKANLKYKVEYKNNKPFFKVYDGKKILFDGFGQHIGIFNSETSIFHWSWNVPFINKKMYNELLKIKDVCLELESNYENYNNYELEELYFYCSSDNFYCNENSIVIPLKISKYYLKADGFIIVKNKNIIEFILIKNINNTY